MAMPASACPALQRCTTDKQTHKHDEDITSLAEVKSKTECCPKAKRTHALPWTGIFRVVNVGQHFRDVFPGSGLVSRRRGLLELAACHVDARRRHRTPRLRHRHSLDRDRLLARRPRPRHGGGRLRVRTCPVVVVDDGARE